MANYTDYIVRETGYPGVVKQEVVGELTRCKDCLHWNECQHGVISPSQPGKGYCSHPKNWGADYGLYTNPDHYCGFAERRE